ncbi:LuxR family transcriptional regulator [Paenibacillus sp. MWE-103]|uniref:LuxR family transcriptional regulator n=1 Tax=Paenibacillus artemisiicola TaxID=1172618 RepID=A0ABS3WKV7_9BACL|nr:LuxR C-terminal-related transcriptional regulator [Paenibacillus artemisiicola]MBO7748968.1 LuxR family transcriptional regulator [Paenibacillus artemisiicola]
MSTLIDRTLLKTKMRAPHARDGAVQRERLHRLLDAGLAGRLTAVCAPAGYGKTTLLAAWTRGLGHPAAWLSLDELDNDPGRFWRYAVHALDEVLPEGSLPRSIPLAKALPSVSAATFLDCLINELFAVAAPVTLVLDDYHAVANDEIHRGLAYLLDYLPPHAHLLIASRAELPFPTGKWTARQERANVSVPELRFTMDELEAYGSGMADVPLSERQLDRLLDRTEGWIAGLQLAFISLRTQGNREKFIADFQGHNRNVAEFLFEEAFGHLPADIRAFLLATSVLDRMNAEAANAVTARPDGREMLARLNALQLFLIPLDERGEWFRYHQLFATFLRGLLKRDDPAGWLLANRKASESCAALGLLGEAIDHAIAAGDFALTRALLERHVATVFRQGELATLLRWFGSLPADAAWPADMRLLYALILAITGQADLAEGQLAAVKGQLAGIGDETERRAVRSGMLFVESNVIFFGGRFERWQSFAEGASADMLPDSRIFYDVNYNLTEPLVRRTTLGLKGLLNPHTEAVGLGFLRVLETHGWQETFIGLYVRQSLAEGYYEWNRLEDSRAYARGLEAAARRIGLPGLYVPLAITRARLLLADRQPRLAHEAIDLAMEAAETHEEPQWLSGLRAAKARVYLAEDRPADAKKALAPLGLSEKDKPAFNREYEYATLARLLLRQRKYSAAIRLLAWLKPQAEREGLLSSLAELALLLALAEHGRGRRADGFAALREALAVGEANGYVRSFADEGLAAAELLQAYAAQAGQPHGAYAARLLAAFPAAAPAEAKPAGLVEPLLESELALMDLVRRGASNREIAGELALSLGTVKVYLSRVYGKLGVSSRTQALNRAEQLGLLEDRG